MAHENIALVDLDGTVADHDQALLTSLQDIHGPNEPPITLEKWRDKSLAPTYMFNRMQMIRSCSTWWENLPEIPAGMLIVDIMMSLGYRIVVLTQSPRRNPSASKGKIKWIGKHMPPGTDYIVTRDKSLTYGKVLFDDYPAYIDAWLAHRPRGLAIMPAFEYNKDYEHPNVIRYDGDNLADVVAALKKQADRNPNEPI